MLRNNYCTSSSGTCSQDQFSVEKTVIVKQEHFHSSDGKYRQDARSCSSRKGDFWSDIKVSKNMPIFPRSNFR